MSTPIPAGEQEELDALRLIARRLGVGDDVRLLSAWAPLGAVDLRDQTAVSGAADLLLRCSPLPVLGVTGSAGKTTTARLAEAMLRESGVAVQTALTAPADNAWPTAELLERVLAAEPPAWCVAELTSNHLAVCSASPHVACITNVWADHVDQHGSLAAYLAAKARIVAFQAPADWTVVNADDPGAVELATGSGARRLACTLAAPAGGDAVASVESGRLIIQLDGELLDLGPSARLPPPPGREAGLLAGASALLAGAHPDGIARALERWRGLALRRERLGEIGGSPVIRDALAATPAKAAAGLALHADRSVVLIAGGYDDLGGGAMHASPEERELLERAAAVGARACVHAALFGPAGPRLAGALRASGLASVSICETLAEACDDARAQAAPGRTIVFAPWFPTTPGERASFPELLGLAADGDRSSS